MSSSLHPLSTLSPPSPLSLHPLHSLSHHRLFLTTVSLSTVSLSLHPLSLHPSLSLHPLSSPSLSLSSLSLSSPPSLSSLLSTLSIFSPLSLSIFSPPSLSLYLFSTLSLSLSSLHPPSLSSLHPLSLSSLHPLSLSLLSPLHPLSLLNLWHCMTLRFVVVLSRFYDRDRKGYENRYRKKKKELTNFTPADTFIIRKTCLHDMEAPGV